MNSRVPIDFVRKWSGNRFYAIAAILTFACVFDTFVALRSSQTFDEDQHIAYGEKILRGQPDRDWAFFDSKTPISALNAVPQTLEARIPILRRLGAVAGGWKIARLPSVLAILFLDLLIYVWTFDLFGSIAAFASLFMAVLSPNLIAHGTLATTDGYFGLGVVLALYSMRKYLLKPTITNACIAGFVLAFAQLTKPLAIYLYGIGVLFLLIATVKRHAGAFSIKQGLVCLLIWIAFFVAVLNVAYCFDRSSYKLASYKFESSSLIRLQKLPGAQWIRIPVPYPYLQGLDMMMFSEENGLTYGRVYLLGELRSANDPQFHGFKSYYAIAWFFKEPIALQILFIAGVVWTWKNRSSVQFLTGEGLLLTAAAILVLWLSLFDKAQVGIRHIIPALAIEVVFAAAAFSSFSSFSRRKKVALGVLMLWLCASTASYYPEMIPYMNEWVFDRKLSYKILADSNLDWGQNQHLVRDFLRNNPDVVLNPDEPVSGRVLVNANRLVGIWPKGKGPLFWALRYRPVAHVGYAHLLYVIPANADHDQGAMIPR